MKKDREKMAPKNQHLDLHLKDVWGGSTYGVIPGVGSYCSGSRILVPGEDDPSTRLVGS